MTARHAALTAAVIAIGLLAGSGTAAATASPVCLNYFKIENVRQPYSYEHFGRGPEWKVEGYGPGTLTLARTLTASNSVSGTVGIDYKAVSANVGFDVTESTGLTASYAYPMPPDRDPYRPILWTVEAGTRDTARAFDVQEYSCMGKRTGPPRQGRAVKTGNLIYKYYGKEESGHR
jgi:hypothetical protein